MFDVIDIVLPALAAFGISALISQYDGLSGVLQRVRLNRLRRLASCTVCLSVWVAIPISIVANLSVIEYFATLGFVILLERLT